MRSTRRKRRLGGAAGKDDRPEPAGSDGFHAEPLVAARRLATTLAKAPE